MCSAHSLVSLGSPGLGACKEGSDHPGWRKGSAGRAWERGQSVQTNVTGCPGTLAGGAQPWEWRDRVNKQDFCTAFPASRDVP